MTRIEQTISPIIRGAGRTFDIAMPQNNIQAVGNVAMGITWMNRQGLTTWDEGTSTGFGVPPAGTGYTLYKGRIAHRQTGSGTSGGFYQTGGDLALSWPQTKSGASVFNDDVRCWRVSLIAAFDGGVGTGDTGLEIATGGFNYDMRTGTPAGFRLGPGSAADARLSIRQNAGGAFTFDAVVANIDVTEWHMYEMRFIGATDKADAVFRAFIDGAQVMSFSWGAGTILPGVGNGYRLGVGNRGVSGTYTAMLGLGIQGANTEAALL